MIITWEQLNRRRTHKNDYYDCIMCGVTVNKNRKIRKDVRQDRCNVCKHHSLSTIIPRFHLQVSEEYADQPV